MGGNRAVVFISLGLIACTKFKAPVDAAALDATSEPTENSRDIRAENSTDVGADSREDAACIGVDLTIDQRNCGAWVTIVWVPLVRAEGANPSSWLS
jgi:hypothetical protein